jgi:hypothetical protein
MAIAKMTLATTKATNEVRGLSIIARVKVGTVGRPCLISSAKHLIGEAVPLPSFGP